MSGIKRYGVPKNPYKVEKVRFVNPQAPGTEPLEIDGFRCLGVGGSLSDFFVTRKNTPDGTYVLVRGPNGIGRTLAARQIMKKYEHARAGKLIAPDYDLNNDPVDTLNNWVRHV